ncbi:hypothetical protein SBA5_540068 [Candidatus Sulfotelmatomonas gaucii]|uniref:Uncharacterized protein n=1 Tax=Candidatus Sulfuritelmatomonas gaucii TaxID=2043161 RepID=A0A2N9LSX0_9BACT|nr:hypothetical protein SBA5_540068 [Candidatus Sulfotelmatomonas gaucii]
MNVVACSADRDGECAYFPQNSAEIRVHIGLHGIGKERRTSRGGEDNMCEQAGKGVHHSYAPPGLWDRMGTFMPQARAMGLNSRARYAGFLGDGYTLNPPNERSAQSRQLVSPYSLSNRQFFGLQL